MSDRLISTNFLDILLTPFSLFFLLTAISLLLFAGNKSGFELIIYTMGIGCDQVIIFVCVFMLCMHVCMYVCIYVCMCMYVSMQVCVYVCIYVSVSQLGLSEFFVWVSYTNINFTCVFLKNGNSNRPSNLHDPYFCALT
jgi:hypothetical protein